jgi:hypothetical protein
LDDVKGAARRAINDGALTMGFGPNDFGMLYGEITSGFNCHNRGGRRECRGAASPISGGPFAIGDVIMNPSETPLSDDVFRHEARHSNQWAAFGGWGFLPAYLGALGLQGECNVFEGSAGFRSGGYSECASQAAMASARGLFTRC